MKNQEQPRKKVENRLKANCVLETHVVKNLLDLPSLRYEDLHRILRPVYRTMFCYFTTSRQQCQHPLKSLGGIRLASRSSRSRVDPASTQLVFRL